MPSKNKQQQVCSLRLGLEEYGWLVRYCDKQGITMSSVMRKALQMYRTALANKRSYEPSKVWGNPIKIMKNEDYEFSFEVNDEIIESAFQNLSYNGFKVWFYFYKQGIGNIIYCRVQDFAGVDNYDRYLEELIKKGYLIEEEDGSFTFQDLI